MNTFAWTVFTNGPYMEMLVKGGLFAPQELPNEVLAFAAPVDKGYVCMIALDDLAFYVDWIFSNPEKSAGIDLAVSTEDVTWDNLVKTFVEVTGRKAVNVNISADDYFVTSISGCANSSLISIRKPKLPPMTLTLFHLFKILVGFGLFGGMALSNATISYLILFTPNAFLSSRGWRSMLTMELASRVSGV